MLHKELQERLDSYIIMWAQSPAASRVDAVEGFAMNHGFPPYEDQTIPEVVTFILNDLLVFLAENPSLLDTVSAYEPDESEMQRLLAEEQVKIDEAVQLVTQMRGYVLGPIDPRYRKVRNKCNEVIRSFRLSNKNHNAR